MPTALDTKLVPKALDLIDRFGINATFKVPSGAPTYSNATRAVTNPTTDVVRKVSPPGEKKKYGEKDVIRRELTVVFVAASGLTFTPAKAMVVTIGGTPYTIEEVVKLYSGEQVAAWELGLAG